MLWVALVLLGLSLSTLLASYLMTRAGSRSALWNIVAGGLVAIVLALVLLLTALTLVRRAFA